MSEISRKKLANGLECLLAELGSTIEPSEIYGVLEGVKMAVHDGTFIASIHGEVLRSQIKNMEKNIKDLKITSV